VVLVNEQQRKGYLDEWCVSEFVLVFARLILRRISSASLVQVNGLGVVVPVVYEGADGGGEFFD
jgi:hypothetical protein